MPLAGLGKLDNLLGNNADPSRVRGPHHRAGRGASERLPKPDIRAHCRNRSKVPQADIRRGLKYSPRTQNCFTRSSHRAGRPEMLAPKKRQAKAWTLVPHFARRTVSSASDASLRLTAQEDDEIRALAGLRAQLLV